MSDAQRAAFEHDMDRRAHEIWAALERGERRRRRWRWLRIPAKTWNPGGAA